MDIGEFSPIQLSLLLPSHSMTCHPKVISFEGLIGVGKSTLIKKLTQSKARTTTTFDEHINPHFLKLFYSDTKRYGFAFQYGMLKSRLYQWQLAHQLRQQKSSAPQWHLWDRSMLGDFIFAQANHEGDTITDKEMDVYTHEFGSTFENVGQSSYMRDMDAIMLLVDTPGRCKARVETLRQNESEKDIPLAYYERLDALHFQMFYHLWQSSSKYVPPILVANWEDLQDIPALETRITQATLQRKASKVVFEDSVPKPLPNNARVIRNDELEGCYTFIQNFYNSVGSSHSSTIGASPKRYVHIYLPDPKNGRASEALRQVVYLFLSRGSMIYFCKAL